MKRDIETAKYSRYLHWLRIEQSRAQRISTVLANRAGIFGSPKFWGLALFLGVVALGVYLGTVSSHHIFVVGVQQHIANHTNVA